MLEVIGTVPSLSVRGPWLGGNGGRCRTVCAILFTQRESQREINQHGGERGREGGTC